MKTRLLSILAAAGCLTLHAARLSEGVEQITWFGERPDWRHDGRKIVFLSKVFGDVYEYDLETRRITPCTDHFLHLGFLRALYLSNGDLLLTGPDENFNRLDRGSRNKARGEARMFVLDKSFTRPPVPLGWTAMEGPAVSRHRLRIAWTHARQTRISIGDLVYRDGVPALQDVREILTLEDFPEPTRPQRIFETQNFVPPDDTRITVTAYQINGTTDTETYVFDLRTRALENMSRSPETYDEAEGIFPDGRSTLVESGAAISNWPPVDLYRLALDGSGRKDRLTFFSEYEDGRGTQGVVSDDGSYLVFQRGRQGSEAGQGFGLFLLDLRQAVAPAVMEHVRSPRD